ncbi:hypothetical protein [Saccharicrinis carchari]|uniref:hypothetical protein n=1 Tax=Saccharicrinis carchari TaxID=1168039 RepID=UPI00115A2130|nr:hypothetical protein [Saccharicrinis carchari]
MAHVFQTNKEGARKINVTGAGSKMMEHKHNTLATSQQGRAKKLARNIERSLRYPRLPKSEKSILTVVLMMSKTGKVTSIKAKPKLDAIFL